MRFSKHATEQMAERRITLSEVEEALQNPETSYPSPKPGRDDRTVILGATNAGRRLKVVVLAERPDHVVTVADRDED